jgi:hypothetical protein
MRSAYDNHENICLWRLAMTTIGRTVLLFTLPYLVAYYSVIGAWQGIHMLMLWVHATR